MRSIPQHPRRLCSLTAAWVLGLAHGACATAPEYADATAKDDTTVARPDSGTPSGTASETAPTLTESEVGDRIVALLDATLPNGRDFIGLFRTLAQQGDGDCPGADLAFTTPTSSCIASTGWEYFGYAPYVDRVDGDPGARVRLVEIGQASFVITDPDGPTFSAGGGFVHTEELDSPELRWEQSFSGTFIWTGEGPAWLEAGSQLGWTITGSRPTAGHRIALWGPLSVGAQWMFIDRLDWDEARCEGIPEVDLRVRDQAGHWYRWTAGSDCSACGPIAFLDQVDGEQPIGELCFDLSAGMASLDAGNHFGEDG